MKNRAGIVLYWMAVSNEERNLCVSEGELVNRTHPTTMSAAIHPDLDRVLLPASAIREQVRILGQQMSRDYAEAEDVLLVGILKGCVMFLVDLSRALSIPVSMDFIAISSYGASSESSGVVQLLKDLETDITGRHVLVVEDIVDSGLTLAYLRALLWQRGPASLRICTLLNKPERRTADVPIEYVGFDIPNEFVVGYGLDFNEHYRNLPYIGVLKPEVSTRKPGWLSGR
jgi:hypoxanthine phosphoribosyltransferase